MNYYQSGYVNPYQMQQPMTYGQPIQQPMQQPVQQTPVYKTQASILQGKTVDSIDVVKATDIPFDRKCKLFPINRWNGNNNKADTNGRNK